MPVPMPPYAYVPGAAPRHDPALFAPILATVHDGMSVAQLAKTDAWRAGWVYFRAGYFWEAHEVLEPVWMQTLPNSAERHLVQALIQTANAGLKARMNRPRAVRRLCDIAVQHLNAAMATRGEALMGLRFDALGDEIAALRDRVIP